MKLVIGVIVGYALWTAIWLGGNAVLLPEAQEVVGAGKHYAETGPLGIAIGLSVVCSLVAGFAAARIAGPQARAATLTLAILLLATGVGVQLSVWELMPVWYHVPFLLLLVPVTIIGSLPGRPRAA